MNSSLILKIFTSIQQGFNKYLNDGISLALHYSAFHPWCNSSKGIGYILSFHRILSLKYQINSFSFLPKKKFQSWTLNFMNSPIVRCLCQNIKINKKKTFLIITSKLNHCKFYWKFHSSITSSWIVHCIR